MPRPNGNGTGRPDRPHRCHRAQEAQQAAARASRAARRRVRRSTLAAQVADPEAQGLARRVGPMAHRFFLTGPLPAEPGQPLPLGRFRRASRRQGAAGSRRRARRGRRAGWRSVANSRSCRRTTPVWSPCRSAAVASAGHRLPVVTLFQGVAKGEKMDDIVRQAVEVGAEEIVGVMTSRARGQARQGEACEPRGALAAHREVSRRASQTVLCAERPRSGRVR